jgi:hypothetical protein
VAAQATYPLPYVWPLSADDDNALVAPAWVDKAIEDFAKTGRANSYSKAEAMDVDVGEEFVLLTIRDPYQRNETWEAELAFTVDRGAPAILVHRLAKL